MRTTNSGSVLFKKQISQYIGRYRLKFTPKYGIISIKIKKAVEKPNGKEA